MLIVKSILVIIEIVTCLLLVTLILLQKAKSGGAGLAFGSAMGESLFGTQTGNILTKATVVLTIIFLVNTIFLTLVAPGKASVSVIDTVPVKTTAPSSQAGQPQQAPAPTPTSFDFPSTPGAAAPAADAGAPVKADQPMQPDAAASLPVPSKDTGTGEQPSK